MTASAPRTRGRLSLAFGAALAVLVGATLSRAGLLVPDGKVAFEIRQNGSPLRDSDFEVAVRTRDEIPPRVVFQGRNRTLLSLPRGSYDCLVTHHHLPMEAIRYHRFTIAAGETVVVASDVRTHELVVRPYLDGRPADDRAAEVEYQDTTTGVTLRHPGVALVLLPAAQYRVRLRALDASGATVVRERTFYLACTQELRLDL